LIPFPPFAWGKGSGDGGSQTPGAAQFDLPTSASTAADLRHPDKAKLKETILALRAAGWSYRQIGREVGLHWTRIGQILKDIERK
jgi:hypothetical protein